MHKVKIKQFSRQIIFQGIYAHTFAFLQDWPLICHVDVHVYSLPVPSLWRDMIGNTNAWNAYSIQFTPLARRGLGIAFMYRHISNINRISVGNKFVDHSDGCSWSIACRRCSNYIFILDLTRGFNGLGKDNCKTRQGTFKFGDLVRLILET